MPNIRSHSALDKRRARWDLIILACMYVGYMAFILSRTAIQVASPEMLKDPHLALSKSLFGEILAWGTAGMVVGKLTTGIIADRLGGRRVFLLALLLVIIAATLMGFANSYRTFAFANFIMLFAAAAGWPAMAGLIAAWYPAEKLGKVWGIVSTSSRLSSVLSMFFLGNLLARFAWPNLFFVSAALGLLVWLFIYFFLKARPSAVGLRPPVSIEENASRNEQSGAKKVSVRIALASFLRSRRFWLICASLMATSILMEFIGFLPLYLSETLGVDSSVAATASSVFPAGCLIALIGGGFLYDRVSRRGRIALLGAMLSVATACVVLLWFAPSFPLAAAPRLTLVAATLFLFGLCVAPSYYLPMSVFSVEFGGIHCGLLIGLIDATGYFSSMIFQAAGGHLVESGGWASMLKLLLAASLVAAISTIWFAYEDYLAHHNATNII